MVRNKKHRTYNCKHCGTLNNFKGNSYANIYCNNQCQKDFERKKRIDEWLKGKKYNNRNIPGWLKDPNGYIAQRDGYKCSACNIEGIYNNQPIVLECDHIDGDHTNQSPKNLRLLCPNCHSQTETFKGRNK